MDQRIAPSPFGPLGLLLALQLCLAGHVLAQDDGGGMASDDYEEDDGWERPPAPEAPKPKAKPVAVEETVGDGKRFDAGAQLLWGNPTGRPLGFLNDAWQLGFGVRAAYTDDGTYVVPGLRAGLHYAYYLGELGGSSPTASQLIAVEAGFDWWIADGLVARPSVDIGAGILTGSDVSGTRSQATRGGFYFGPGLTLMHPMDLLYVGGEVRGTILSNNLQSAITLAANVGARF